MFGKQVVHGIGHHPAQPAETVGPAYIHAPHPAQVVERGSGRQCRYFHLRCVQLSWGQRAVVNGQFMRCVCGFKQGGQGSGLQVLGEIGLGHKKRFQRSRAVFSEFMAQNRSLIIALKCMAEMARTGQFSKR